MKRDRSAFIRLLPLLLFLLFSALLAGKTLSGRVIGVKDGDTIVVLADKTSYTIRLDGIDCPEKQQSYGEKAKQFTSAQVFAKPVRVVYQNRDRYLRILGTVYYSNAKNLGCELLKAGLAWHYKHYNKDPYLAKLENQARNQRKGLWAERNPVPPWEFRRQKRQ